MLLSTRNWIIYSFIALAACSHVERPDSLVCGVNAKSMKLRCYNIKTDFTDDGVKKPDAKAQVIAIKSIDDLNAGIYFSPKDFEKIKVWIGDMRDWSKAHCN